MNANVRLLCARTGKKKAISASFTLAIWTASVFALDTNSIIHSSGSVKSNTGESMTTYQWVKINGQAAFAPRDGAGAVVFRGKMWLIGGWNPNDKTHFPLICNNEVWSSKDGNEWILEKPNAFLSKEFDSMADWEGRHTAGYVVFKDRMWILGGDCNQMHYQNDVWNSADGKKWERVATNVPWAPRNLQHTLVFNGRIWVMGGQTMGHFVSGEDMFYNDVWNTSDGVQWIRVAEHAPWAPRGMIGGSIVFKNRMWILGGGTYSTPKFPQRKFYNDVWSSADGVRWEQHLASAPWKPRQYHDVAVFDGKMWIMEGWNEEGGNRNDAWYSVDGINWHEVPDTPWKPRHAASVFVYDNALWMAAGNNMESDVWKLRQGNITSTAGMDLAETEADFFMAPEKQVWLPAKRGGI